MPNRSSWFAASLLAALLLPNTGAAKRPAAAEPYQFPPVKAEELAFGEASWQPNAPAVVLWRSGVIDYALGTDWRVAARIRIASRTKILRGAGRELAEQTLLERKGMRLVHLTGRTVAPNGRVTPLPASSIFESTVSERWGIRATRIALSEVESGTLVDLHTEYEIESFFLLEPWSFHGAIPTLYSEVVFSVPEKITTVPWESNPSRLSLEREQSTARGRRWARFAAREVPALLPEAFAPPLPERATRITLVPAWHFGGTRAGSFELVSWRRIASEVEIWLASPLEPEIVAQRIAPLVAGVPAGDRRERARRIYHWVRDVVSTGETLGNVYVHEPNLRRTLLDSAGTPIEKALLLDRLLQAAGLSTSWLLGASEVDAPIDEKLPSVRNLDRLLIGVELDGSTTVLDPSDACLSFGQLAPESLGRSMLRIDRGADTMGFRVLSDLPATANRRDATIELVLEPDGTLTGQGRLVHTGLHAHRACRSQRGSRDDSALWKQWLEGRLPGFAIDDVAVDLAGDRRTLSLSWKLRQHEEEAVHREVLLVPSQPLGPVGQILPERAEERRSPVQLPFADLDTVELHLRWPEEWRLEAVPAARGRDSSTAALEVAVEADAGSLTYRRSLTLKVPRLDGARDYVELRELIAETEKSDAQAIVLVRR